MPASAEGTVSLNLGDMTTTERQQLEDINRSISQLENAIASEPDWKGRDKRISKWKQDLEKLKKQRDVLMGTSGERIETETKLGEDIDAQLQMLQDALDAANASIDERNAAIQAFLDEQAEIARIAKEKRDAEIAEQEAFAKKIREEGVLGESGIKKIVGLLEERNKMNQAARNREIANIAKGQQKRLGKRLGVRSGAVDTEVLNRVLAPNVGQNIAARGALAGAEAELTQMNELSKTTGFGAVQDILNFVNTVDQQSWAQRMGGQQLQQGAFQYGVGTGLAGQQALTGMGISADQFGAGLGFDYAGLGQQGIQFNQSMDMEQQQLAIQQAIANQGSGFSFSNLVSLVPYIGKAGEYLWPKGGE